MSGGINTTRNGATIGVEGERKMADEHGNYGFRTEMRNNPDGSVTMLRTRDGWNEFTTSQANVLADKYPRGFGMAPVTATASTLFVPDDWRTLTKNYTPRMPTFFVMPKPTSVGFNPKENHKWYDVLSWQGAEVRVNGIVANPLEATCSLPAACIPYCLPANVSANDATYYGKNLTFFISKVAVYSLVDGVATRTSLHPETPMWEERAYLGGQLVNGNTATMRQLFWSGDFISGFWNFLSATFEMTPGAVSISGLQMQPVDLPPPSLGPGEHNDSTSTSAFSLPDISLGYMTSAQVVGSHVDERTGLTTRVDIAFVSEAGINTYPSTSSTHWIDAEVISKGDIDNNTFTAAGVSFTHSAHEKKIVGRHDGYVYVEAGVVSPPIHHGWSWTTSLYHPDHGWDSSDGFSGALPYNTTDTPVNIYSGEISASLRQNYHSSEFLSDATLTCSASASPLIRVRCRRYEELRHNAAAVPLGYTNGNLGGWVARGTVSVYVPAFLGTPPAEWWGYRDGVVAAGAAHIGEGIAAYSSLTVMDYPSMGYYILPFSAVTSDSTLSESTIEFTTTDHFIYDQHNGVFGEIIGNFSGSEDNGSASTKLTVSVRFTTPGGTYEKTLFDSPLGFSNLLPFLGEYPAEWHIPAPWIRNMFCPRIMTQGCFHGITYTTTDEINGGAAPHFFANFTLSLCDHLGGTEKDESSGTGTDLVVMPGHLLEMLYCYVYSNSYGQHPDYVYPVTRGATYNHLQKNLFQKSWVVHLHNSDKGTWTGNVDLAAFDTPSTGVFRT